MRLEVGQIREWVPGKSKCADANFKHGSFVITEVRDHGIIVYSYVGIIVLDNNLRSFSEILEGSIPTKQTIIKEQVKDLFK